MWGDRTLLWQWHSLLPGRLQRLTEVDSLLILPLPCWHLQVINYRDLAGKAVQAAEQPDFQEAEDALFREDAAVFVLFLKLLSAVRDICAIQQREPAHLLWFLLVFP